MRIHYFLLFTSLRAWPQKIFQRSAKPPMKMLIRILGASYKKSSVFQRNVQFPVRLWRKRKKGALNYIFIASADGIVHDVIFFIPGEQVLPPCGRPCLRALLKKECIKMFLTFASRSSSIIVDSDSSPVSHMTLSRDS